MSDGSSKDWGPKLNVLGFSVGSNISHAFKSKRINLVRATISEELVDESMGKEVEFIPLVQELQ
jgi:hypothetical protein